jgi:hypothetical protein
MIRRNLNPAIIISIMNYYNVSQLMVMNDDDATDLFKTTVGVRQGGTISPKLFNIYVEDIIKLINESSEKGVNCGDLRINVILYADDIVILSHNKRGINKFSRLIEQYGEENEIKFTAKKTFYMVFNKNAKLSKLCLVSERIQPDPTLCGEPTTKVSELRYLGLEINDMNKNSSHLKKRRSSSYAYLQQRNNKSQSHRTAL